MSDIKNSHELWFVKSCDYKGLRETFDALDDEIDKLEAENAALKEERRWISAKQFLPKSGRVCPVWDEKTRAVRLAEHFAGPMAKYPVWAMDNGEKYYKYTNNETYDAITFWYDLPELPEAHK